MYLKSNIIIAYFAALCAKKSEKCKKNFGAGKSAKKKQKNCIFPLDNCVKIWYDCRAVLEKHHKRV